MFKRFMRLSGSDTNDKTIVSLMRRDAQSMKFRLNFMDYIFYNTDIY